MQGRWNCAKHRGHCQQLWAGPTVSMHTAQSQEALCVPGAARPPPPLPSPSPSPSLSDASSAWLAGGLETTPEVAGAASVTRCSPRPPREGDTVLAGLLSCRWLVEAGTATVGGGWAGTTGAAGGRARGVAGMAVAPPAALELPPAPAPLTTPEGDSGAAVPRPRPRARARMSPGARPPWAPPAPSATPRPRPRPAME